MKKLLVLFIVVILLTIGNFAQARDYGSFEIPDPDEALQLSENQVIAIAKGNIRSGGLGASRVVEYFGKAHCALLSNAAKEAGFTATEAQGLVDVALIEKRTLKGKGSQALTNFYDKLDKKRAERGTSLDSTKADILTEVDRRIAEAKADIILKIDQAKKDGLTEGKSYVDQVAETRLTEGKSYIDEAMKPINDEKTGLKATYTLAQKANDDLIQVNQQLDQMDTTWGVALDDVHSKIKANSEAINKVDRKARLAYAVGNYLSDRVKVNKDKSTGSNKIVLPNTVDGQYVEIGEKVLPEEKPKDSAPASKKSAECK